MKELCDYCGEEKAQVTIMNPNAWQEEPATWDVCITCDKIIKEQMNLTFGMVLSERPLGKKYGEELMRKSSKNIRDISREADKEVFSMAFKPTQENKKT